LALAALAAILFRCSAKSPVVAGTSSGVEARIAQGVVTHENGRGAADTRVWLIPSAYDPVKNGPVPDSLGTLTDSDGRYSLHTGDTGTFNIVALCNCDHTRLILSKLQFIGDSLFVPAGVLHAPGSMVVTLDSTSTGAGYLYVPGTGISISLKPQESTVILDSVPSGVIPEVNYCAAVQSPGQVIRYNVTVPPATTVRVFNPAWMFSKQLALNTSATGANVSGNVLQFPVLVRLSPANFSFSQAKRNGEDVRFTRPDNTPLAYEIEQWDSAGGAAAIWVKADTVFGNNATQFIVMYWGNPAATALSSGPRVFDTANGFVGVWHLGEPEDSMAMDATWNHFDGTPENMTAAPATAGAIGSGRHFNGQSSYLDMMNTASGKLNFPENGTYAISAWVLADSLNGQYHLIASKGDLQYNLELKNTNEWEFTEYEDTTGWDESTSMGIAQVWTHIVGVRHGGMQYLYVNGSCVDNAIYTNVPSQGASTKYRDTTNNFMIGKKVSPGSNSYFFSGSIDEVRVLRGDPGPDWVKLCYMNQRADDQLVVWGN
jgi:hypothetical protein